MTETTESNEITNKTLHERGLRSLKDRLPWERKIARACAQRHGQDRPLRQNTPWPGASNVKDPVSDTMIEQLKPFYFKVIYSARDIATFTALIKENLPFGLRVSSYFDYIIKQKTDFEREIQYAIDALLQDAECVLKITWDFDKEAPRFTFIDNLFIITPSATMEFNEAPWVIEVRQLFGHEVVDEFSDVPGIKEFVKRVSQSSEEMDNDQQNREQEAYRREGINFSGRLGRVILWECHYLDKSGSRRIRTISPDEPDFDFQDDHEYLAEWNLKNKRWCYEHHKYEMKSKHLHSARGIPEITQEDEYLMSAMRRSKHNAMALFNNPILYPLNGVLPSTAQNMTMMPGQMAPIALGSLQLGTPPFSWDEEINNRRSIIERRVGTPDFGIGKSNTMDSPRTATEVKRIGFQQSLGVEMASGNWKMFVARCMRQAWGLICQYKPQSLKIYRDNEIEELPVTALNDDYLITLSGSAESVNKEYLLQEAVALLEYALKLAPSGIPNLKEIWTFFVSRAAPGMENKFTVNPEGVNADARKKALESISAMITTLMPVEPSPTDDLMVNAQVGLQFLQNATRNGLPLAPIQIQLVSNYIAQSRELLKSTNKAQYEQLTGVLNQLDQASHQLGPQNAPVPLPLNNA